MLLNSLRNLINIKILGLSIVLESFLILLRRMKMLSHEDNENCCCTSCYMNKADAIAKNVMTKQANVKTEGTKFEDDGEDGCYIDYRDFHEKMYDKPIPLEGSVFKYPYNNGLAYDKHLELNSFSGTDG